MTILIDRRLKQTVSILHNLLIISYIFIKLQYRIIHIELTV